MRCLILSLVLAESDPVGRLCRVTRLKSLVGVGLAKTPETAAEENIRTVNSYVHRPIAS